VALSEEQKKRYRSGSLRLGCVLMIILTVVFYSFGISQTVLTYLLTISIVMTFLPSILLRPARRRPPLRRA